MYDFGKQFESREIAGKQLADQLEKINLENPYLLAIPRGGIQVAEAVADRFKIPIDVIMAKKLPLPFNPEVAMGAMTEDEIEYINQDLIDMAGVTQKELEYAYNRVNNEIKHRIELYGRFDEKKVENSSTIIVDDGVATGSSLIASIKKVKKLNPKELIVAVPVSTKVAYNNISPMVDKFISIIVDDRPFFAVSKFYEEWEDLSEDEIINILEKYRKMYQ